MFDFYSRKELDKELKKLDNKCNTTKDNFKIFKDKYEKDMKKIDRDIRLHCNASGILNGKIDYNEKCIRKLKSAEMIVFIGLAICIIILGIMAAKLDKRVTDLESKVYETQVSTEKSSLGE